MGPNDCSSPTAARRTRGFTLVELMVVVIVLAIGLVAAIPSFTAMTRRNAIASVANEVVAALQTAKMEAIRRNRRVSVCPSTNGTACGGTAWNRMIVLVDGTGEVVADHRITRADVTVTASTNAANGNRIRFGADGLARVGTTAARTGAISICMPQLPAADNTRDVRVRVSRIWTETRNGTTACSQLTD